MDLKRSGTGVTQSIHRIGHRLDNPGSIPGRGNVEIFSLRHCFQTEYGAHPASCPMGTRSSYPGGKTAGALSWQLTSIYCRG